MPLCAPGCFFHSYIVCPKCMLHKPKEDFHRNMVCRGCQGSTSTSVASMKVELDCASFRRIFGHQANQGARLNGFQRCAIVTLWAVNLSVDQICQMTGCDPRTITDKITKFREELSLNDMPQSGRPGSHRARSGSRT
jgi:hypothetical protein